MRRPTTWAAPLLLLWAGCFDAPPELLVPTPDATATTDPGASGTPDPTATPTDDASPTPTGTPTPPPLPTPPPTAACAPIDFWVRRGGPVRVPLGNFPASVFFKLRVRRGDAVVPVEVAETAAGEAVALVYAPEPASERAAYTREVHFFADCDAARRSPVIETAAAAAPEGTPIETRIVQTWEVRARDRWVGDHPPSQDGRFVDAWAAGGTRANEAIDVDFPAQGRQPRAVSLDLEVWGGSQHRHAMRVTLNGVDAGVQTWERVTDLVTHLDLPAATPIGGVFRVRLALESGEELGEKVFFRGARLHVEAELEVGEAVKEVVSDRETPFLLALPRDAWERVIIWDVTAAETPVRQPLVEADETRAFLVEPGRRYVLFDPTFVAEPEGLAELSVPEIADQEGDLLIVAAALFHETLAPLVEARAAQGWTPVVVQPRTLYQQFTAGAPGPEAITAWLEHAFANWTSKSPRALLLVGDASPELYFRPDRAGLAEVYVPTPFYWGQNESWVPSDVSYGRVGEEAAGRWVAVGRLPVRGVEELQAALARGELYEAARARAFVYVSDDNTPVYEELADGARNELPEGYPTAMLHLREYNERFPPTGEAVAPHDEPAAVHIRADLATRLREGAAVVQYFGHGSFQNLAGEAILSQFGEIKNLHEVLTHGGAPPLFMTFNCLSGFYASPEFAQGLSEAAVLMRDPLLGVVGMVSPADLTSAFRMQPMAVKIQTRLAAMDPAMTLGEALAQSSREMLAETRGLDLQVLSYSLMGDPSLPSPGAMR